MVNETEVWEWVRERMTTGSRRGVKYSDIDARFGHGTTDTLATQGVLVWRNPRRPTRVKLGVLPTDDAGEHPTLW
jgi:hypothetical protein